MGSAMNVDEIKLVDSLLKLRDELWERHDNDTAGHYNNVLAEIAMKINSCLKRSRS